MGGSRDGGDVAMLGGSGGADVATMVGTGGGGGADVAIVIGTGGSGGLVGTGGGGAVGGGGTRTTSGTGGIPVFIELPDGGLAALLGDSGILNIILDAPRDGLLGQLLCGPEAKLGAPCSADNQICVLPSLGGGCLCVSGTYLCPFDTTSGPTTCPLGAQTGGRCLSPLTVCIGGGANACLCGLGSYTCF